MIYLPPLLVLSVWSFAATSNSHGSRSDPATCGGTGVSVAAAAADTTTTSSSSGWRDRVRAALARNDTETAFVTLAQVHGRDPQTPGLRTLFEEYFHTRIRLHEEGENNHHNNSTGIIQDRMGLGSLLTDRGAYGAAARQFQAALEQQQQQQQHHHRQHQHDEWDDATVERLTASLYKARAATCDWTRHDDMVDRLQLTVQSALQSSRRIPAVHPYEALMWPSLSIGQATDIASQYAQRALYRMDDDDTAPSSSSSSSPSLALQTDDEEQRHVPFVRVPSPRVPPSDSTTPRRRKIRLGYISNDFTGKHPLGLLMQDVFRFHNHDAFDVYLYSLMADDDSPEVQKMRRAANHWTVLAGQSPPRAVQTLRDDALDVLVDLTGYTGTSTGVEILSRRPATVQLGHMGFPASSGPAAARTFMDHLVCDTTTVPPHLRHFYAERALYMPHCFFANSHGYLDRTIHDRVDDAPITRAAYGLPEDAFVFCCHNRAEKIDPATFDTWLRVLEDVPDAVLWMLSSGPEMEDHLRTRARQRQGNGPTVASRIIFCPMVPRPEHLQRIRLADLFLDTPAYNAHTTGCDCLSAGVPMVSLLRTPHSTTPLGEVATDKMASRVGASFLRTLGLDDALVASDLTEYAAVMRRAATDPTWFHAVRERLRTQGRNSPLFDMARWIRHWEAGLTELVENPTSRHKDVYVVEVP